MIAAVVRCCSARGTRVSALINRGAKGQKLASSRCFVRAYRVSWLEEFGKRCRKSYHRDNRLVAAELSWRRRFLLVRRRLFLFLSETIQQPRVISELLAPVISRCQMWRHKRLRKVSGDGASFFSKRVRARATQLPLITCLPTTIICYFASMRGNRTKSRGRDASRRLRSLRQRERERERERERARLLRDGSRSENSGGISRKISEEG